MTTKTDTFTIKALNRKQVRLSFGFYGGSGTEPITFRGIPYGGEVGFINEDGDWKVSDFVTVRREDTWKSATPSTRVTLVHRAEEAFKEWVTTDEATEALMVAEVERRRIDEIIIRRQLDQAQAKVEALKVELIKLDNGEDYTPYPGDS